MDAVAQAIAAAQGQANTVPAAPVVQNTGAVPAAAPLAPGKRRSLDDAIANAGTACEYYFAASDKMGIVFDKDESTFFDDIEVELKLSEMAFPYMVKYQTPAGVQYARSYDGILEARTNLPWAQVVAEARRVDQKCQGQYDSVEFVGTLLKDYKTKGGKEFKTGARVGHSTSTTGTKFMMAFVTAAQARYGNDTSFKAKLVHKKQEKGTYKWGVLMPEFIDN